MTERDDPISILEELARRGHVEIDHYVFEQEGGTDVVRVALDVPNGFAVSRRTVKEALIRIGEEYL